MAKKPAKKKPSDMKFKPTARGFMAGAFKDRYGYWCSLQESSLATEACIWLGVAGPNPKIFPGDNTGWHDYQLPKNVQCTTRMHLTQAMVAKLLPALQHFVETGALPREA
jgi:hypothetical protein